MLTATIQVLVLEERSLLSNVAAFSDRANVPRDPYATGAIEGIVQQLKRQRYHC